MAGRESLRRTVGSGLQPISTSNRTPGVDALRLVGAVMVMGLHVGPFQELPAWAGEAIRSAARWVVPFFFWTMGYFAGRSPDVATSAHRSAARLLAVLLRISVIFLLLHLCISGPRAVVMLLLSTDTVIRGVWFHLWFLHAALLATLLLSLRPTTLQTRTTAVLACFALLACCGVDTLVAMHRLGPDAGLLSRSTAGVAMYWLGACAAQRGAARPHAVRWALVVLAGGVAVGAQAAAVTHWGGQADSLQLPLGALAMAVALFFWSMSLRGAPWLDHGAALGRRWALGLYLLHPLWLEGLQRAGEHRGSMLWAGGTALSIASLMAMERWLPRWKAALDGR